MVRHRTISPETRWGSVGKRGGARPFRLALRPLCGGPDHRRRPLQELAQRVPAGPVPPRQPPRRL